MHFASHIVCIYFYDRQQHEETRAQIGDDKRVLIFAKNIAYCHREIFYQMCIAQQK